jgi:hypothetical protein
MKTTLPKIPCGDQLREAWLEAVGGFPNPDMTRKTPTTESCKWRAAIISDWKQTPQKSARQTPTL